MLYDQITSLWQNKKIRISLIVLFTILLVGILLFSIFRTQFSSYSVSKTPFNYQQSYVDLQDDSIYAYNGVAFYSTDIDNGKVTILNSGTKLPHVSNISWLGSQGALIMFDSSFIHTAVEKKLGNDVGSVNSSQEDYVWYFDFATSELQLVSKIPLNKNLVSYLEKEKRVYFVPEFSASEAQDGLDEDISAAFSVKFYDIARKKTVSVVSDSSIRDVSAIHTCGARGSEVCLIASTIDNPLTSTLFEIKDTTLDKIIAIPGRIEPTNNPELVIAATQSVEAATDDAHDINRGLESVPAKVFNVTTKKSHDLGFTLANQSIVSYFSPVSNDFFIVSNSVNNNDNDTGKYISGVLDENKNGKITKRPLQLGGEKFNETLVGINRGSGTSGALIVTIKGDVYFIHHTTMQPNFTTPNLTKTLSLIDPCIKKYASSYQVFEDTNQIKIFIIDNSKFDQNVKQVSLCIAEKGADALSGIEYYLGGLSPVNGRITTD